MKREGKGLKHLKKNLSRKDRRQHEKAPDGNKHWTEF